MAHKNRKLKHILLLAPKDFWGLTSEIIQSVNPSIQIVTMEKVDEIMFLSKPFLRESRLLGFLTQEIVPQNTLNVLGYGAFNFHPGSPEYPGWAPCSFAIYDRVQNFGVTLHHMEAKVDAGPIVAIDRFKVSKEDDQGSLEGKALDHSLKMLNKLSSILSVDHEIPSIEGQWSSSKTTKKQFYKMCNIPLTISKGELLKRIMAFGLGDSISRPFVMMDQKKYEYHGPDPKPNEDTYVLHQIPFIRFQ